MAEIWDGDASNPNFLKKISTQTELITIRFAPEGGAGRGRPGRGCGELVKILPAVLCAAQTMDLLVLDGELVVVGDLLPYGNGLPAVDDNLALPVNLDHFRITVRLNNNSGILVLSNAYNNRLTNKQTKIFLYFLKTF